MIQRDPMITKKGNFYINDKVIISVVMIFIARNHYIILDDKNNALTDENNNVDFKVLNNKRNQIWEFKGEITTSVQLLNSKGYYLNYKEDTKKYYMDEYTTNQVSLKLSEA